MANFGRIESNSTYITNKGCIKCVQFAQDLSTATEQEIHLDTSIVRMNHVLMHMAPCPLHQISFSSYLLIHEQFSHETIFDTLSAMYMKNNFSSGRPPSFGYFKPLSTNAHTFLKSFIDTYAQGNRELSIFKIQSLLHEHIEKDSLSSFEKLCAQEVIQLMLSEHQAHVMNNLMLIMTVNVTPEEYKEA